MEAIKIKKEPAFSPKKASYPIKKTQNTKTENNISAINLSQLYSKTAENTREELEDILKKIEKAQEELEKQQKEFDHKLKKYVEKSISEIKKAIENHKLEKEITPAEYGIKLAEILHAHNYQGDLYSLRGRNWEKLEEDEYGNLMQYILKLTGGLKSSGYNTEIITQVKYNSVKKEVGDNVPILLKNGYLQNGKFSPYPVGEITPFSPHSIPLNYKSDCQPVEIVDQYLKNVSNGEAEYKDLLLEMLGYCFITNPSVKSALSKFFILVGSGGNGKGTLLKIIAKILGEGNCSYVSHGELADERYFNNLRGKLVNLADDIPNIPLKDDILKTIKNVTSCDNIAMRELYKNSFNIRLTTTLIFTSNHILKSWEKDHAFKRRIVWIPMDYKPKKYDANYLEKITTKEALEYWLYLAIQGYFRLYENGKFTESKIISDFNSAYHLENNNIEMYLLEKTEADFINKKPKDAYQFYLTWVEDEGLEALGQKTFLTTVQNKFDLNVGTVRLNTGSARVLKAKK